MHKGFRGCGIGLGAPGSLAGGPVRGGGAAPLPQTKEGTAAPGGEGPHRGPAAPLHRCGEPRSRDPRSFFSRLRAAAAMRTAGAQRCKAAAAPRNPRAALAASSSSSRRRGGSPGAGQGRPRFGGNCCAAGAPRGGGAAGLGSPSWGCMQRGGLGAGTGHQGRACGGSWSRTGLFLPPPPPFAPQSWGLHWGELHLEGLVPERLHAGELHRACIAGTAPGRQAGASPPVVPGEEHGGVFRWVLTQRDLRALGRARPPQGCAVGWGGPRTRPRLSPRVLR